MATTDKPAQDILTVVAERDHVCVRPGAVLDDRALSQLEDEARSLIGRGFSHLTVDLRKVETVEWTTAATLAAITRSARRSGARLTVIPGSSPAVQEMLRAGLMQDLTLQTPAQRPFFDWSH
ncbi:MAG TPA: STAS domain-containing protein [Solirubrobacteraceae bacterium]